MKKVLHVLVITVIAAIYTLAIIAFFSGPAATMDLAQKSIEIVSERDWLDYLVAFAAIVPIAPLAVFLWRKYKKRR